MALQLAADLRTKECDASGNDLNSAKIRIYDLNGNGQKDVDVALGTEVLLAELTMGADAFAAATDDGAEASIVANAITSDPSADATGTADFFRVVDSLGTTTKMQGTCSNTGGGGDMELSTTSIAAAAEVSCTAFTYRRPQ